MKIVDFAVKRPVTMIISVAVVLILGFFTLSKLPLDLYPDMTYPMAVVFTDYPGAGPEEVESQVSKPLEDTVATLPNVKEIQSHSLPGQSLILISFNWGTDMDGSSTEIRERISLVEKWLPEEVEKPMVAKMDPNIMPVLQVGMTGEKAHLSQAQLQSLAEDVIKPRLSRIPEVASVEITGGLEREIKVEIDPVRLESYGLSLSQVTQVLQMENFNMSSGEVKEGGRQYYVRSLQQFETVDDIKQVAILTPQGNTIYMKDIANIEDGYKEQTQKTRVDAGSAVGIHFFKQSDANTVTTCTKVKEELEELEKELKIDLDTKVIMDQSQYITMSLDTTKKMIVEGAILAMLILLLFLRSMRSTLIIFTAIPLSIIATFILLYFNNSTLNLITLGGLALGVGRIVDDSIVVFENIYRHRLLGLSPREAAVKGASEVGSAVIAATLTIIAVFLPIVFTEGMASILFKPLAITVSFAIFCSLVVALTIIPLLSSRVLTDKAMEQREAKSRLGQVGENFGRWMDNLGERYKNTLQWALNHRSTVIITVTVLFVLSVAAIPLVGAEFLPKMDSGEISVTIEADKGNTLETTDEITREVEKRVGEIPEVETRFTSVGAGGNMMLQSDESEKSTLYVKLRPRDKRDKTVDEVAEDIRQKLTNIPGARIKVNPLDVTSMMSSGGGPVNVQIRGDDLDVLQELSTKVAAVVRKVPGTREVSSSLTDGSPEIQVKIDRQRAAMYGLTPMQVAQEMKTAMAGTVATRYRVGGDEVDVRVQYTPQGHDDMEYMQHLNVMSPAGFPVKLSQIATFELEQGPVQITRQDQVRQAEISAHILNRDLKAVMNDIETEIDKLELPAGYTVEYGGEDKEMRETFEDLVVALILAIILVYAVMAVQYESFFSPFVIMFSVPVALIGVVGGLLITGRSLSVPAFIGLIMLVGIVVSNAIVLVDYLQRLRAQGMERDAAILEAGRVRLRPILMTAFSTILAMVPLSLGIGEGGEAQAPLATVVVGGLLVSTLVTLLLVPVVYSILDDWGQKFRQRRADKSEQDVDLTV